MFASNSSHAASTATKPQQIHVLAIPASGSVRHRDSTTTAYAKDVKQFVETYGGTIPCSADDVIAYTRLLMRRVAPATIARRIMAIQDAHVRTGLKSPTDDERVREALRHLASGRMPPSLLDDGKATSNPTTAKKRKEPNAAPITRALMMRILDGMGSGRRSLDLRDKAIFLMGFVGGLKRGTICAINLEDLTFTEDAMLVQVKSIDGDDGKSAGRKIAIPFTRGPLCAATAVLQWISVNALEAASGPLICRFTRSGEPILTERLDSAFVSKLVKGRMRDAGIEDVTRYSGESLRLGHLLETVARRRA